MIFVKYFLNLSVKTKVISIYNLDFNMLYKGLLELNSYDALLLNSGWLIALIF